MDGEELERMTGKMFWAMVPSVIGIWVAFQMLDALMTFAEYWHELGLRAAARRREREDA